MGLRVSEATNADALTMVSAELKRLAILVKEGDVFKPLERVIEKQVTLIFSDPLRAPGLLVQHKYQWKRKQS